MDLKQEVSLSALKRGKAPAYPVKTSINLVDTQQQRGNLLAQLGLFTIALALKSSMGLNWIRKISG